MLELGRVLKPHGLRGELKIRLYWSESDALSRVGAVELVLDGARRRCAVEWARTGSAGVLLKLGGVDDRNAAEACRGAAVCVAREQLGALGPGEFYLADLIGCEVVAPRGSIGRVVAVSIHPTVDCLVIEDASGRRFEQPLTEPWLEKVDLSARRVRLVSTEGLID